MKTNLRNSFKLSGTNIQYMICNFSNTKEELRMQFRWMDKKFYEVLVLGIWINCLTS